MKRLPLFLFLLLGLCAGMISCQKELSYEVSKIPSQGTLQKDGSGDCLPKTVVGTYEEGVGLSGTANYLEVEVNVLTAGSYVIASDTVNGIFFRATGIFTTTGLQTIKLPGSGTPFAAGIHNFVVSYGTSQCVVAVTTLPPGGGVPAEMTLDGAPGNCIDYVLNGSYITGTALNSSNQVVIKVNVTTAGTYNISTPVSNGITFAGAGTVSTTGPQTITLTGSGTPLITGATNIPVTVGASSCSFEVNITGPAVYTINCGSAVVSGTYVSGEELDNSHDVEITVNVTTPGGYNITGTINGMTFSATGNFSNTGNQPVTLSASGIPTAAGDFNVPLNAGTAACTFPVTVDQGAATFGTWAFTAGGINYSGTIELSLMDVTSAPTFGVFQFFGGNAAGDVFSMSLVDVNKNFTNNETYSFASLIGNTGVFTFDNAAGTISYSADPSQTTVTLAAKVTNHNTATKTITGTFTGKVMDDTNTLRDITAGSFTVTYP